MFFLKAYHIRKMAFGIRHFLSHTTWIVIPVIQIVESWSTDHIFFHSMASWRSVAHWILVYDDTVFAWLQLYIWSLWLKEIVFKVSCVYICMENAECFVFTPNTMELACTCWVTLRVTRYLSSVEWPRSYEMYLGIGNYPMPWSWQIVLTQRCL